MKAFRADLFHAARRSLPDDISYQVGGVIPPWFAALMQVLGTLVGIGLLPARRAAAVAPVVALKRRD
jgi:hypothetical protein